MAKQFRLLMAAGVALLGVTAFAYSAEVKVLSDGPFEPALTQIGVAYQHDTANAMHFVFGLSPVIHKRVMDGEPADVVLIHRDHFWRSTRAPRRSWPTTWNEFLPI